MKIILTGSLGNIGKPLATELVKNGHSVTVISSNTERINAIEALGAKALIGSIFDANFLTGAFTGADVVYLMETMEAAGDMFDTDVDFIGTLSEIGLNYKKAVEQSGVKKVIHLSSIGAHTDKDIGILLFHHNIEKMLRQLPPDVSIKFIRPVGFYINMFSFIHMIKSKGAIISNYGGDKKEPWVSPLDIADAIIQEFESPFEGKTVRYVASDDRIGFGIDSIIVIYHPDDNQKSLKMRSISIVITIFLLCHKASGQVTQVEATGGTIGGGLSILMNSPIDEKKQFSFVSIAFFNKFYSDADAVLDENLLFGGILYNIGKGFSTGPSFRINNLWGFTKKASLLYVHQGKRLTFAALPLAAIYNDRIDWEIFLQLQYNNPISENWAIFAQLQGDIYAYKFSKIKRSYQQFRIGPAYKSFQFGIGLNLDQYGSNDITKINLLIFYTQGDGLSPSYSSTQNTNE